LTAEEAEIGTLKTSGIDGNLNVAGNASVTGNASIAGETSTDSVNTKYVTVHNADNTGTVTTDELNVTESARLAEAEIGEINGGLVVNGDIIADDVTTGDIMANDITASSATADNVKTKIIAPKDGEEEVRHTASRSQFDHDVYVDGTLYVDTLDVDDLTASHAYFLGQSTEVTADSEGNFSAGKNASIGGDLDVAGDINLPEAIAGETTVSGALAALQNTKASVIDPISVAAIASGSSTADWSSCTALVNYIREHQSAPSTLVVNASGTVYTLMLTGSEWPTGSGSGHFAYKGLGINGNSGKPFIIEVLLETADSNIIADILNNAEVALQEVVTSLQSTVSSVQSVVSAHSTAIEGQERQIYEAMNAASAASDTASSALSKANTNSANFAPAFVTTKSYKVGEYVTYNSVLYRCTTAHSAGAWVASHFTQVTVGEDMYVPWTTIYVEAIANADSSGADADILLDTTSVTIPAGTYFATALCMPIGSSELKDDASFCTVDMWVEPFTGFSMDLPHSWIVTGANAKTSDIGRISAPITFNKGTKIGVLNGAKVQSGKSCEFRWMMTFTRLSTH
jgi:hypothetical protein